jgi:hypothetical protein
VLSGGKQPDNVVLGGIWQVSSKTTCKPGQHQHLIAGLCMAHHMYDQGPNSSDSGWPAAVCRANHFVKLENVNSK